jgi:hypothetical protein
VSPDLRKGGEATMLLIATVFFLEVLVANTGCAGLVVSTLTLPKLRLFGLSFKGGCAKAGAGAARLIADRSAKPRTESVTTVNFGRDMDTPPANCALLRSARHHPLLNDLAIKMRLVRPIAAISPNGSLSNARD